MTSTQLMLTQLIRQVTVRKYDKGLRFSDYQTDAIDLNDDSRFAIEHPGGNVIGGGSVFYGSKGKERYIYITTQSVGYSELLLKYNTDTVDQVGWEHQWISQNGYTQHGGYDFKNNKFIILKDDRTNNWIQTLDPVTGEFTKKVSVGGASSSFGTFSNVHSYSGGKFYLSKGGRLWVSEDAFDSYEEINSGVPGSIYGHTIYKQKHYFISSTYKKLYEVGVLGDNSTLKEFPLPSVWNTVSNRMMLYIVGDYLIFYASGKPVTLFDGENYYTSESLEGTVGYPQTPFSINIYGETGELVRTELIAPSTNRSAFVIFDAPAGAIPRDPWTAYDDPGETSDPEPAKLFFNDERIALVSDIPDSSLLEHEVSKLDDKVETVQEKVTVFVSEVNSEIEDTLESANKYTDDEIIKAKKHAEDYTDNKISLAVPTNVISDSGNNQVTDWTIDSGESRYISVKDNALGLYHLRDPQNETHAVNKRYVDGLIGDTETFVNEEFETRDETIGVLNLAVNSFEADLNTKLPLTGGTLEGDIRFQPKDNSRLRIHLNNASGQSGLDLRLGGNTYSNTFRIMGGSGAETETV